MSPSSRSEVPSAVYVACPDCGEETLHTVLKGTVSTRHGYTLDATVSCTRCRRVHHVTIREAGDVDVPVVVSEGPASTRTRVTLPGDEEVRVDTLLTVDERPVLVTSIESKEGRRVNQARVRETATLWAKTYDEILVKFSVNLGHKTISKEMPANPDDEFHVGEEYTFGRLRVTAHAIKTAERMMRRGSASAGEISRVFAKPTPPDRKPYRPPPEVRARQAAKRRLDEDWAEEPEGAGVRPRTRSSRRPRGGDANRRPSGRGARFGNRKRRRLGRGSDEGDHEEESA